MDNIVNIFISIGKAHLIGIAIVILSYIIEKSTGLKLLIDHYTWIKSRNNIEVLSTRDTGNYLILNSIVFIYDIYNGNIGLNFISIAIWLVLIIILTKVFYRIHKKYQKYDPNKADDDYT